MEKFRKAIEAILCKNREGFRLTFDDKIHLLLERILCLGLTEEQFMPNLHFEPGPIDREIEKILIVQLSSIGDVVYVTPVISALRERYPKAYLSFLIEEEASPIVLDNPYLDEVVVFKGGQYYRRIKEGEDIGRIIKEIAHFASTLNEKKFDYCLNLHTSARSALLVSLIEAKNTAGLTIARDGSLLIKGNLWMLSKHSLTVHSSLDDFLPWYNVESNLKAAGLIPSNKQQRIFIDEESKERIDSLLRSCKIEKGDLLIGLNPGSNVLARQWLGERFARLGDLIIREYGARILLFGGERDRKLCKGIENLMENSVINLSGETTLRELFALIARCDHFITNDTGPMHIADAVGTRVIAVCGPTRTGPYGGRGHLLLQAKLPCINCGALSRCEKRDCMKAIEVGDVLNALKYQRGEIQISDFRFQISDRTNVYTSGNRPPTRLFDYYPLKPAKDGQIGKHLLRLAQINLWIKENLKFGCKEELLTHEEIIGHLGRYYHSSAFSALSSELSPIISGLSAYEAFCQKGIERLKEALRLFPASCLLFPKIEEFNRIDLLMVDHQQKDPIYKLFAFYDFVYPKESDEVEKSLRRYLKVYLAKRKAALYLREFLGEFRRQKSLVISHQSLVRILALRTEGNILPVIFEDALSGFRQLGHKVKEVSLTNLLELKKEVEDFRPDIVFITNFTFPEIFKDYLTGQKLPHASYFADDPLLWAKEESVSPFAYLFVWDRSYIEPLRKMGFRKVFYLPLAANPEIFTDKELTMEERERFGCQISFAGGSLYSYLEEAEKWGWKMEGKSEQAFRVVLETAKSGLYRAEMVSSVADLGLNLYGDDGWLKLLKQEKTSCFSRGVSPPMTSRISSGLLPPPTSCWPKRGNSSPFKPLPFLRHRKVCFPMSQEGLAANEGRFSYNFKGMADNRTKLPLIYKASKINLNLTRPQLRTALNMRVFDICACGGFLLTDYREDLKKLFDFDSEIVCFYNRDDLREKTKYYLKHSEERKRAAEAAKRRVLKEHTYKERMKNLIETITSW